MFITSFGEQNITYRCCSNLRSHLSIDLKHLQSTPLKQFSIQIEENPEIVETSTNLGGNSTKLPVEGLEAYLEKIEKEILLNALNLTHWNRTLAAKKLGMTFRSLRYRLKKFGLDTDEET